MTCDSVCTQCELFGFVYIYIVRCILACVYSAYAVCSTYFTGLLKIAPAPSVIVCLCVTDTSEIGGWVVGG